MLADGSYRIRQILSSSLPHLTICSIIYLYCKQSSLNKLGFFAVAFTITPVVVLAITGPMVLLLLLLVVVVVEEGELVVVLPVGVLELDTFFSFGNLFLATLNG